MKKVLVIVDGIVAKKLLDRMVEANTGENSYDIIYMNDDILPSIKPSNFIFYQFDPTSLSKLVTVLNKEIHTEVLIALRSKDETINVIKNIRIKKKNIQITIYNNWGIELNDPNINSYNGIDVLANGLLEKLPNIPVVAQNIGLREGEIMEIRVPFGSTYAYRYIGSIEQKEWKIFGLYRNQKLINIKPSLILKPNDIILIIGNPKVLMQVYSAITKSHGQFPMPFGQNIYLFLDSFIQEENEILTSVKESLLLHQKLKNKELHIKITRPTSPKLISTIRDLLNSTPNVNIEIDYHNIGLKNILNNDKKRFDIGLIVLSHSLLKFKETIKQILDLKIPIYKLGESSLAKTKKTVVLLNDTKSYEQISPMIFDISSQFKTATKIFNITPIENDKDDLIEHFENLSKIFNHTIEIVSNNKNPIRELKKERNALQILPLKKAMFDTRIIDFFSTDSDLLSFDLSHFNQLLIPIIEE